MSSNFYQSAFETFHQYYMTLSILRGTMKMFAGLEKILLVELWKVVDAPPRKRH